MQEPIVPPNASLAPETAPAFAPETGAESDESIAPPALGRRNMFALTLDVTFFCIGVAFLDPSAVLPLLLMRLGASGQVIGASATLRALAFGGLQIFVAYATHRNIRQKPPLLWVASLTRLPLLVLPIFLFHAVDSNAARIAALWATILLIGLWSLGDGLGYVPWMEIVARSFSERTRGRFFTSTQVLAGLVSVLTAAFLVRPILESHGLPFPYNYALLTGLFALAMQISLLGVACLREPPPPRHPPEPRPPLGEYLRRLPQMLRENPTFTRLSNIELLIAFGGAAQPFYILEAKQRFHLSDSWGGIYQTILAVSVVAVMPLWTWLSEKRGAASAVRGLACFCLLTPLIALTVGRLSPWLYGLVFLTMGGSLGMGMWIVINHFLLAHVPEKERSAYVGLLNLRSVPAAFYPLLGGLLVPHDSLRKVADVPVLFLLVALVTGCGVLLSLRLPAPEKTP